MTYKEVIYNAQTGNITEREYTVAEIAEVEAAQAKAVIQQEQQAQAEAAKAAALAKLAALGLTTDDLKALGLGGNK